MARFSDVDIFLAVAEARSFRQAAARLSVTRSTVSRAIARLEEHLGCGLFLRDTSSVRLTPAGVAYKGWARKAAAALTEGERIARATTGSMSGRLRITAPPALGPRLICPVVSSFVAEFPDVEVQLLMTDRMVNPILEGVDLAVRGGERLPDSDLKSRRLADFCLVAVASPDVAAGLGEDVPLVVATDDAGNVRHHPNCPVPHHIQLRVNDYLCVRDALVHGAGVGVLSEVLVREELAAGTLVPVLPMWKLGRARMWAVYPARGTLGAPLRTMLDRLVVAFQSGQRDPKSGQQ